EARFWQNNFAGATEDINTIRARANSMQMYTVGDVQTDGIGAVLDERNRELFGEEYRHDELVRISVILAKTGKSAYNGKAYSITGNDIEKSLSTNSFYYDRVIEKNSFFRDEVAWATFSTTKYTMDPMHIFWPVYEPYLIGNVNNVLNQTTGYDGAEKNVEPLTHVVQPAGKPNVDPMEAIGERGGE
ncbi:MAG: RagB/SusD family nutrient uptake outer membrane protein, partial [Draconibacterium sp.]|nr:RagB/SusD family nutrient uptake outer membrane protein [Draconibacterium sp.]